MAPDKFHLFSCLPPEIRLQIWDDAMYEWNLSTWSSVEVRPWERDATFLIPWDLCSVGQACVESRSAMKKSAESLTGRFGLVKLSSRWNCIEQSEMQTTVVFFGEPENLVDNGADESVEFGEFGQKMAEDSKELRDLAKRCVHAAVPKDILTFTNIIEIMAKYFTSLESLVMIDTEQCRLDWLTHHETNTILKSIQSGIEGTEPNIGPRLDRQHANRVSRTKKNFVTTFTKHVFRRYNNPKIPALYFVPFDEDRESCLNDCYFLDLYGHVPGLDIEYDGSSCYGLDYESDGSSCYDSGADWLPEPWFRGM